MQIRLMIICLLLIVCPGMAFAKDNKFMGAELQLVAGGEYCLIKRDEVRAMILSEEKCYLCEATYLIFGSRSRI